MDMLKTITVCGGGSLGHVIAGWLSAHGKAVVNLLTGRPGQWHEDIDVDTPEGIVLRGHIARASSLPQEVIPQSDVVLLCLPGFLIAQELQRISPHLHPQAFVGSVFSSTGFFFEAFRILNPGQPLWGFQRVPFISRVGVYGQSAHLLGYKDRLHLAVENVAQRQKESFARLMEDWFQRPVCLLSGYLEASLTNSNPLLHTSRLYTMFSGENEGRIYPRMILFYEEWTPEAADLLIRMDEEFFRLLGVLPVTQGFLPTILDYYESHDAVSLAAKLSSIRGFKGIPSPMKEVEGGWGPDFSSRYFVEDFPYGLRYIAQLAHDKKVACPLIDKVLEWGMSKAARG